MAGMYTSTWCSRMIFKNLFEMHKTYFNVDTLTWVFKSAGPPYVNIKVATFVDKIKMPMHHLTLTWLWCLYMDLWLFVGRASNGYYYYLKRMNYSVGQIWTNGRHLMCLWNPSTPSIPKINQLHSKVVFS